MKFRNIIPLIAVFTGLLGFFGCEAQPKQVANIVKARPTFNEQLEVFKALGFRLNDGVSASDVENFAGNAKEFEDEPFGLMYQTLGQTLEREPGTPLTNKCWTFDLEAIDDNGAYVQIMKNISRITNGDLKFEGLNDSVDVEKGKAWVSFTINGDKYKWNLKVDDDWADGSLFDKVQELAEKYQTKGRFTFYSTGGQDFVLGYHTKEELDAIREKTGLDIVWLKAKGQIY